MANLKLNDSNIAEENSEMIGSEWFFLLSHKCLFKNQTLLNFQNWVPFFQYKL